MTYSGLYWACASCDLVRQSCVMAADPGSNNLEDFDIEQVINWDEHNYASKNLEFQHLPDLDLPTDVPVTGQSTLPTPPSPGSHGGRMMRGQVMGTHPTAVVCQNQDSSIMSMTQPSHTSSLNPVFPPDASCIISDIRQELGNRASVSQTRTTISPTFPSENFDLPPLSHPHHMMRPSSMNYMQRSSPQMPGSQQLVHNTPHQTMHPAMSGYNQANMQRQVMSNMPVNHSLDSEMEGDDHDNEDEGSIEKLIEDIVDRDLPQGIEDPIVFPQVSHAMPLGSQHSMIQRPGGQGQLVSMSLNSTAGQPLGSPVTGSNPRGTSNNPMAGSPMGQNPGSPLTMTIPGREQSANLSGSMHKSSLSLGNAAKPSIKLLQQQPASPQIASPQMGMSPGHANSPRPIPQVQSPRPTAGMPLQGNQGPIQQSNVGMTGSAPSPRSIQQNTGTGVGPTPLQSPYQVPQMSPQSVRSPLPPSPISQMSPPKFPSNPTGMQTSSMPQSPVRSPMNAPSPQAARPPQPSAVRNLSSPGSQVVSKGKDVAKLQAQAGYTPRSSTATSITASCKLQTTLATSAPYHSVPLQSSVMPVSGGKPMQKLKSTMQIKNSNKKPAQTKTSQSKASNASQKNNNVQSTSCQSTTAQNNTSTVQATPSSSTLKGSTQAHQTTANVLTQAMLLKAVSSTAAGQAVSTGQPVSVATSQGKVIYYVLPKGTNLNTAQLQAAAKAQQGSTGSGQPLKMILINAKTTVGGTKPVGPPVDAAASVPLTQTLSCGGISIQQVAQVMQQKTLTAKTVGNNNVAMSTLPLSTMSSGTVIMSTGQENGSFTINTGPGALFKGSTAVPGVRSVPVSAPSNPSTVGQMQSAGTTKITFINESSGIRQFVDSSGDISAPNQLNNTAQGSSEGNWMPRGAKHSRIISVDDESDSDSTPLAELADHLKANGGDTKKKRKKGEKRKRKTKIEGEPPKPLSAYQIFFKETQAAIRLQNPSFGEIAKIVGQMWENLPEEQKKVYHCKHETAKAEYQKAMDELISKQKEPKAKLPKLESPLPTGKPKFSIPKVSTAAKEGGKPEGARIKIPKKTSNSVVKPEGAAKSSSPQAAVGPFSLAPSTTASNMISKTLPSKPKKTKLSINPISQRVCARDGCSMPARTTKERGTQYCSNECIINHCRMVFNSWVENRKTELQVA
ncbi:protein piccolo isoform X2 [Nematostella vectensis]|uniref:protein piccolo isoform X2 n=1 Tax=Nematostella vectensis TaxID=45351 RepID=UPI002076F86E|nr:protein piccolo isoform X2 [Nematostella vectensis]